MPQRARTAPARSPRRPVRSPPGTRAIAMVGFEGAAAIDIVGPLEVFNSATHVHAERAPGGPAAYRVELLSADGGAIRCAQGLTLSADRRLADATSGLDT